MILETLLGLCIIQGVLNNAECIEDNFNRVDRIVMAAKRTRHVVHSSYCHCQNRVVTETTTRQITVSPTFRTNICANFDTFQ